MLLFATLANLIFVTLFNGIELQYYVYFSIILSFLVFIAFLFQMKKDHIVNLQVKNPFLWFFIFAFIVLIFTSKYRYASLFQTLEFLSGIVNFVVVSALLDNENESFYVTALTLIGAFIAPSGIIEYIIFASFPESSLSKALVNNGFIQGARVANFFQYPNAYGGFLAFFAMLALGLYLKENKRGKKVFFYIQSVLLLFAVYLSDSRGVYISLIFGFAILAILINKSQRLKTVKEISYAVVGVVVLIVVNNSLLRPLVEVSALRMKQFFVFISGGRDQSLQGRVELIKDAVNIFKNSPIFGTGIGTFRDAILNHRVGLFFALDPHSLAFRLLAETGLIGAISFFLFVLSLFLKAFRNAKSEQETSLHNYILSAVLVLFIHVNLDLDFQYLSIILLFFIGLALLVRNEKVAINPLRKNVDYKRLKIHFANKNFIFTIISIGIVVFILMSLVPNAVGSIYATTAETYLDKNDFVTANELLKVATSLSPDNADYLSDYALTFEGIAMNNISKEENLTLSIDVLQKANNLNKLSFMIPLRLSYIYLLLEDPKAVGYAKEALSKNPLWKSIEGDYALALALVTYDFEDAKKLAEDALSFKADENAYRALHYTSQDQKNSVAYTALGFAELDNPDVAVKYFNQALNFDSTNAFSYYGISKVMDKRGNTLEETENLYYTIRFNSCISKAYERYFSLAPLISVKTDLRSVELTPDKEINIDFDIIHNAQFLEKLDLFFEIDSKEFFVKSVSPTIKQITLTIPETKSFRIILKGIDIKGKEIMRVLSPILSTN